MSYYIKTRICHSGVSPFATIHTELEIGRICGQMLDVSTDKGQLT